jgi:hypothetical protein
VGGRPSALADDFDADAAGAVRDLPCVQGAAAGLGQCSGMTPERTALGAAGFSASTFPQQKPRRDSDHQDDKSQGNQSKPGVRHALYPSLDPNEEYGGAWSEASFGSAPSR